MRPLRSRVRSSGRSEARKRCRFPTAPFTAFCYLLCCTNFTIPSLRSREGFRTLGIGGRVVVRTVATEDVAARVPERFFPSMSAVDTARMPALGDIEGWLRDAGFSITESRKVLRNQKLDLADQERKLLVEIRGRYSFIPEQEVATGLRLMRAEAEANGESWIDPRPTSFITASKTAPTQT